MFYWWTPMKKKKKLSLISKILWNIWRNFNDLRVELKFIWSKLPSYAIFVVFRTECDSHPCLGWFYLIVMNYITIIFLWWHYIYVFSLVWSLHINIYTVKMGFWPNCTQDKKIWQILYDNNLVANWASKIYLVAFFMFCQVLYAYMKRC